MTAETIAKALGGRRAGGNWMARCPAHDDRKPSLVDHECARRQGARALPCRMRSADVIAALRARGVWEAGERTRRSVSRASPIASHYPNPTATP